MHLVENLKLDELADEADLRVRLFHAPLKIQGATGSPVVPLAVR